MKKPYIYCLKDPRDKQIKYIGKTVQPKYKRLSAHYRDKKPSRKKSWIDCLRKKNLKPILEIIEWCEDHNWQEKEKYWIAHYRNKIGNKLTNILEGGNGLPKGYKHSAETIEKIRIAGKMANKGQFKKGRQDKYRSKRIKKIRKKILQYDLQGNFIKVWHGIVTASIRLNINKNSITSVLKNKTKIAGGFQWKYYIEEYPKKIKPYARALILKYDSAGNFLKVVKRSDLVKSIGSRKLHQILNNKSTKKNIFKYYTENYQIKIGK
jgi:hypothetical protein